MAWPQQDTAKCPPLSAHVTKELEAARSGNRPLSIQLSMQFHMILAEMIGNEFVVRQLHELLGRTAMLVAFFEPESASSCGCEEHHRILHALAHRDLPGAARAMSTHLSLIETRLQPMRCETVEMDLDVVLAQEIKRYRSPKLLRLGKVRRAQPSKPPTGSRQPKGGDGPWQRLNYS
jgi:FCD domain